MNYDFSAEDLRNCLDYLNGEKANDGTMDLGVLTRLMSLGATAQRKLMTELKSLRQENIRLRGRLRRFEQREQTAFASGKFECIGTAHCGVQVTTAARAFLYTIQASHPETIYQMNMQKFMILFYDLYANCLYKLGGRMCVDIPKAYGYTDRNTGKTVCLGPWFHPVDKDLKSILNCHLAVDATEFNKINEKMPELAGLMWGIARKRGGISVHELWKWIAQSEPVLASMPEHNQGKWGAFLDDGLIYTWKTGLAVPPKE